MTADTNSAGYPREDRSRSPKNDEDAAANRALVFIKPHAQTSAVRALVQKTLAEKNITILSEGVIDAQEIDTKQLIDQHYYAIASKATLLTPDKLAVPADKFKTQYGVEWADVLKSGEAVNAMQACKDFGLSARELETEFRKCEKVAGAVVKLGGGFYCGKMTVGDKTRYVFNAFFMSMRSKFTDPGASIYYFSVSWKPTDLSWKDFRGSVLGPTKPAEGPPGSLRRMVLEKWQDLGLTCEPNGGDNGIHASASPFEGLAERMNWLGIPADADPFGAALLARGMSVERIKAWGLDPRVTLADGSTGSIFDALEDMDVSQCIKEISTLNLANSH